MLQQSSNNGNKEHPATRISKNDDMGPCLVMNYKDKTKKSTGNISGGKNNSVQGSRFTPLQIHDSEMDGTWSGDLETMK